MNDMNDTQIKTKYGYILQGALAAALQEAGYGFAQDYKYDENCEIPDFLIPDGDSPQIMVETHQTDARNSFQMKTLRAFTAVTEAKAEYGNKLISVNVLFGDPENELPKSNVKAMSGVFDLNIVPRDEAENHDFIIALESTSLELAADESITTAQGISEVIERESSGISELARILMKSLPEVKADPSLFPLWELERSRANNLGAPPISGFASYYKRLMLRALFLNDEDFEELAKEKGDLEACSSSVQEQLVATGLAAIEGPVDGDRFIIDAQFEDFIKEPKASHLRQLCKEVLEKKFQMHWFFEDIRSKSRRLAMAEIFLSELNAGKENFERSFRECFTHGEYGGVLHSRCWFADFMPLVFKLSHNYFNKEMFSHPNYKMSLGNPFNNIAIRSSRLSSNEENLENYQEVAIKVFFAEVEKRNFKPTDITIEKLADILLKFRVDAAIKLRKLDPLSLIVIGIVNRLNLSLNPVRVKSIIGDLAQYSAVAMFVLFEIAAEHQEKKILANFLSVHDNHGDDKSKEWGARRLATLYRRIDGKFRRSEYQEAIFALDGEWKNKDVARLYRSGWNHVVRLDDLEDKLREIFGIEEAPESRVSDLPMAGEMKIEIPEVEIPLAAEKDDDSMTSN